MRSFPILAFTIIIVIAIGIYALPNLNKNEFPNVTMKQGVVAVVYPGATAEEIEEQVAGKVEEYLFTFTDVDKTKTYSYSQNGMACCMSLSHWFTRTTTPRLHGHVSAKD